MAAATPIVLRLSSRDRDDLWAGGGAPVPPAIPGPGASDGDFDRTRLAVAP